MFRERFSFSGWNGALACLVAVLALGSVACSSAGAGKGEVSVVAAFYPVFEAARAVGGSKVEVANLTAAGVEPHDLELSPKQVDQILDADVLLYLGQGFQPAVEDVAGQRGDGVTADLLQRLEPELRSSAGDTGEGRDPHVWLDPILFRQIVNEVRDALIQADPAGGATYEENAEAYGQRIEALDGRFADGLAGCTMHVIVTSHAAFGYLAARYGLRQEPITGISPEAEPDPSRLAQLVDLVHREGVTTIFTEELVSARVAETLAREAGVTTAVLNPLEGLTKEEQARGDTYVTVMDRNLQVLRMALRCP